MKRCHILGQLFIAFFLIIAINLAIAQVNPSDEWVNFYSSNTLFQGAPVAIGTVIDAYDPDGTHCGTYTVATEGEYGFLIVYRDDGLTQDVDEGAMPGDTITFKINSITVKTLGPDPGVWTEKGAILEVDLADNLPPTIENRIDDVVMNEDDPDMVIAELDKIFSDPDNDPLIFSSQSNASGIHPAIDEGNQLTISLVPDWSGEAVLVITAQDQWFTVNDTLFIQVSAVNDPPVIHDLPDTSFSSDTTMTIDLNKYVEDIDHPKSSLNWRADVQPPYENSLFVAIDNPTNIATFITSYIFSAQVEVMFTVTDDSSGSDQETMAVHVNFPVHVRDSNYFENPKTYYLSQNYPNPFNSTTMIHYQLPEPAHVIIKIMNSLGKEVATLVNRSQNSGVYTIQWQANNQASGIYFISIEAGSFSQIRKMVLLR